MRKTLTSFLLCAAAVTSCCSKRFAAIEPMKKNTYWADVVQNHDAQNISESQRQAMMQMVANSDMVVMSQQDESLMPNVFDDIRMTGVMIDRDSKDTLAFIGSHYGSGGCMPLPCQNSGFRRITMRADSIVFKNGYVLVNTRDTLTGYNRPDSVYAVSRAYRLNQ